MVSLVLLAVLRAEQVTARYEVSLGSWPRCTKWCAFAATYLMNTWHSWGLDGDPPSVSGIVLHSVPPLLVLLSAETGPVLRERLTEAARRASTDHDPHRNAAGGDDDDETDAGDHDDRGEHPDHEPRPDSERGVHERPVNSTSRAHDGVHGPVSRTAHEPGARDDAIGRERDPGERHAAHERSEPEHRLRTSSRPRERTSASRRLFADYLAHARAALDQATVAGRRPDPTPAWCRRTTGCSRGTSMKLAAALRAASQEPDVTAVSTTE